MNRHPHALSHTPRNSSGVTHTAAREHGFTLTELLIVIGVVAVLATIAVPLAAGVMRGVNERRAVARLANIGSAANTFRTTMGQRRFPTLAELRQRLPGQSAALISPSDAPLDAEGRPASSGGWLIAESQPSSVNSFAVVATPVDAGNRRRYAVFEDGAVRVDFNGQTPTRNSPPAE